jgi:hypothetical protein
MRRSLAGSMRKTGKSRSAACHWPTKMRTYTWSRAAS